MKNWKPKTDEDYWTISTIEINPSWWTPGYVKFRTKALAQAALRDVKKVLKKARKA